MAATGVLDWLAAEGGGGGSILLDAALKTTLLLAGVGLVSVALSRSSAAVRHFVWSVAVAAVLLLPLLSMALPQWRLPVLPVPSEASPQQDGTPTADRAVPVEATAAWPAAPPEAASPSAPGPQPGPSALTESAVGAPSPASSEAAQARWAAWAVGVWAVGAAAVLGVYLLGTIGVWWAVRRARPVPEDSLWAAACRQPGLDGLRLLQSSRVAVPVMWGFIRPVVLVPDETDDWSEERRQAVLAHEAAHLERADCWTQTLAQFACALYWYNPLAWLAARRMRIERERACDDRVLAAGLHPGHYAGHLLEIARSLRGAGKSAVGALAMARPSQLEGRLLALLDANRSRRAVTRLTAVLCLAVAACVIAPLAATHLAAAHADSHLREEAAVPERPAGEGTAEAARDDTRENSTWQTTLPNGVTVELVGASYHPAQDRTWWSPDGSPLAAPPYDSATHVPIVRAADPRACKFVLRSHSGLHGKPSFRWVLSPRGNSGAASSRTFAEDGQNETTYLHIISATLPQDARQCTLRAGVAAAPWEEAAETNGRGAMSVGGLAGMVAFSKAYQEDDGIRINVTVGRPDRAFRLLAMSPDGQRHKADQTVAQAEMAVQITGHFKGLTMQDISEFHLETRKFDWVEFRNVSLEPGHRTDVEVTVEQQRLHEPSRVVPRGEDRAAGRVETPGARSFGPVIERALGNSRALDFDTGRLASVPAHLRGKDNEALVQWAAGTGVDAIAMDHRFLAGIELLVKHTDPAAWAEVEPAMLRSILFGAGPREPLAIMPARGASPATYLFMTRGKGVGILQITGSTEDPETLNVRYKMMRGGQRDHTQAGLPADVRFLAQKVDETAWGMLEQAVGRALYRAGDSERSRAELVFDFYVDGPKLRWDRRPVVYEVEGGEGGMPYLQKLAYDGNAAFEARRRSRTAKTRTWTRKADESGWGPIHGKRTYTGYYSGVAFNPRALYIPQGFDANDTFVGALEKQAQEGAEFRLEGDVHRDAEVALVAEYPSGDERRIHLDVARGYLVTRSEMVVDGQVHTSTVRRYRRYAHSGAWALESLEHANPRNWPSEILIRYASINQPVPAELFTREALSLDLEDVAPAFFDQYPEAASWDHKAEQAAAQPVFDRRARLRREAAEAGSVRTLGPVTERVVKDDGVGRDMFIDLDTGEVCTPPWRIRQKGEGALVDWAKRQGVDAMGEISVSLRGLVGLDMRVVPASEEIWESGSLELNRAPELLVDTEPGSAPCMPAKGDVQVYYLFRTREWGIGILQITGSTEDPEGLNIRYKMVQETTGLSAGPAAARDASAQDEQSMVFRGIVTDPAGDPLEDVEVRWNAVRGLETTTDPQGRFVLGPFSPPERLTTRAVLRFRHPDYGLLGSSRSPRDAGARAQWERFTMFPPTRVAGRVVDTEGKPVPGAAVAADVNLKTDRHWHYFSLVDGVSAVTDADGHFALGRVPEGAGLQLTVTQQGYAKHITPGDRARGFAVRSGQEDVRIVLGPEAVIHGRVRTAAGVRIPEGRKVICLSSGLPRYADVGNDGTFTLSQLPPGAYDLYVLPESMDTDALVAQPITGLKLSEGEVRDVVVRLVRGQVVMGTVTHRETGEPLEGARPCAGLPGEHRCDVNVARTGQNGAYSLCVPPGDYEISLIEWRRGAPRRVSRRINVEEGEDLAGIDLSSAPRPTLSGRLVDEQGDPVRGWIEYPDRAETDEEGRFAVAHPHGFGSRDHIAVLIARDREGRRAAAHYWPYSDRNAEPRVSLAPVATITGRLVGPACRGAGRPGGRDAADVGLKLWVTKPDGSKWWTRSTNAPWEIQREPDGLFKVSFVPPGLHLRVIAKGLGYEAEMKVAPLEGGEHRELGALRLHPPEGSETGETAESPDRWDAVLAGLVVDENDRPLPGAKVWAAALNEQRETVTDTGGRFRLTCLPRRR